MSRISCQNHLSNQRSVILHYWNLGYRCGTDIARVTNIPVRTIRYNLAKLQKLRTVEHRRGNGRPRKIGSSDHLAIGQWLRREKNLSAKKIQQRIYEDRNVGVSDQTVQRLLRKIDYKYLLQQKTSLLIEIHKNKRIEWATSHLNDDWSRTIFSDETSIQLFSNVIREWQKTGRRTVRLIPKDRMKVMAWGAFCIKGKFPLFTFRRITDADFSVEILKTHLLPTARAHFGRR